MHLNGRVAGGEPQVGGAGGGSLLAEAGNNVTDGVADLVVERLEDLGVELEDILVLVGRDLEDEVIDGHCCGSVVSGGSVVGRC